MGKKKQISSLRTCFYNLSSIDESESESLKSVKSAKTEFEKIRSIFNKYKVGLIHGKLKSAEKQNVLNDFRDNKIQILVATPVVEVGIDIPNLTIIIIEGSEIWVGQSSSTARKGRAIGQKLLLSSFFLKYFSGSRRAVKKPRKIDSD